MNEEEKLDLRALDPTRTPQRWNQLVAQVSERGRARYLARRSLRGQLVSWRRPALALSAALALVAWAGALFGAQPSIDTTVSNEPAAAISEWAQGSELPTPGAILDVLGAEHGAQ